MKDDLRTWLDAAAMAGPAGTWIPCDPPLPWIAADGSQWSVLGATVGDRAASSADDERCP
jgi:hypothetical protein